jgi:hypothetical protein
LTKKTLAYVKNENANLNTMTTTLKSIVSRDVLGMEIFKGTCFGHFFLMLINIQLLKEYPWGLKYVLIKFA